MGTSGPEGDGCRCSCSCCGEEESLCRQQTLIELLRHKETQMQRLVRFLVTASLLLVPLVLAVVLMCVVGRSARSSDCQHMVHEGDHSSAVSGKQEQQKQPGNPSALVTAVSHRSTEKDVLEWEDKRGHAHLDGGFGYFDGNLVVPRDGNYKVYVQITYEKYDDFPCEEELRLFQWVYRFQQSYPDNVTLMSSVDTMSCSMTRPKKSLYASAVFPLKAKDRLWVRSSHPELICHEEHQVFFGADLEPQ
ncbi:tumor necrosis factor ligand superfamily member 15-like [Myripristis murdjan]|uniref:tumor necrosis factor ligand superfamily member 15-like n=1 Tax=Myripristis murdjan TaxID=586833 RepID=UPI0011762941|nr:tumor necrosis factor ligand superfamily member 15-like [Myripristis murdjan]